MPGAQSFSPKAIRIDTALSDPRIFRITDRQGKVVERKGPFLAKLCTPCVGFEDGPEMPICGWIECQVIDHVGDESKGKRINFKVAWGEFRFQETTIPAMSDFPALIFEEGRVWTVGAPS